MGAINKNLKVAKWMESEESKNVSIVGNDIKKQVNSLFKTPVFNFWKMQEADSSGIFAGIR